MFKTAYYAVGIVVMLVILFRFLYRDHKKEVPCDTCARLMKKGGSRKYACLKPNRAITDDFDKPPEYCAYYKKRDETDVLWR